MGLLAQLKSFVEQPPPAYAFELSEEGVAHAVRAKGGPEMGFRPYPAPVLQISPVKENVLDSEALAAHVAALAPPPNGKKKLRGAALILPDYSTRIALLDFEAFPKDPEEQQALVRFRMKKTVPFDMDAAAVSFDARKTASKITEVLVAAAAVEIVSKYEAPFRAAGFQTGFVTTSMLAALDLLPKEGLHVCAKAGGRTLTVAVCEGRHPKLIRCVELGQFDTEEVMGVLFPTFAYAEDELKRRPARMFTSGFHRLEEWVRQECEAEMGMKFEPLASYWGPAGENNAGLLGWLQAQEDR